MSVQVALVDDEQSAREYISRMRIWHEGEFSLTFCASGAQSLLNELTHIPVDIVLMDVSMPDIDGISLSARIKQLYPQTDVIAVSNYDDYDYVRQVLKNGAADYLLKHRLTEETLLAALTRLADQRKQPEVAGDSKYRFQLTRFLRGEAPWPFSVDGSIAVPCFGTMPTLEQVTEEQRKNVIWGTERILEGGAEEDIHCTACYYGNSRFFLLLRFYHTNSRAVMEQQARLICSKAQDHVTSIYHQMLLLDRGPILLDQTFLPDYILHRIRLDQQSQPASLNQLSPDQRSRILLLLSNNDREALLEMAEGLLKNAKNQPIHSQFFLLRSLLEILKDTCEKWKIFLPFPAEGSELLEWMNRRGWEEASQQVLALFGQAVDAHGQQTLARYSEAVRETLKMLKNEYASQLTLAGVAARLNVSEAHLSRTFKRELDCSFNHYLTSVRMEHAKEALMQGRPMKEVAADTGYVQYTHFLRVFKQFVGITPKEYMKRNKIR